MMIEAENQKLVALNQKIRWKELTVETFWKNQKTYAPWLIKNTI